MLFKTKKRFWETYAFHIGVIAAFAVLSLFLPKIPLLRGWEYKLTSKSVELGRLEIPPEAIRIKIAEDAAVLFDSKSNFLKDVLPLNGGPLPVAAWKCSPLGQQGLCVRYIWKNNEPLTLVVTDAPKNTKHSLNPFTKSSWSGYILVHEQRAYVLTGPIEPDEALALLKH